MEADKFSLETMKDIQNGSTSQNESVDVSSILENNDYDSETNSNEEESDVQFTIFLESFDNVANDFDSSDTTVSIFKDDDPGEILIFVDELNTLATIAANITEIGTP